MIEEGYYMDKKLYDAAARLTGTDVQNFLSEELFRIRTAGDESNVLHVAAQNGNIGFINTTLESLPYQRFHLLCKQNVKGESPLHVAAQFGHLEIVETLLIAHDVLDGFSCPHDDMKPCWRERDNLQGDTPLHRALRYGHEDIGLLLLERDMQQLASIDNNLDESAAYLAAKNFCPRVVLKITDVDPNGQYSVSLSGPFGQTAFHPARMLTGDIMSKLIERRTDLLRVQDSKGKTVLHYAVEEKRESVVERLLVADNSLAYLYDNDGLTPLHKAATMGLFSMIRIILNKSPHSIAIRDTRHGKTALHLAKMDACFLEKCLNNTIMKEVINEVDKDGNTPLHLALMSSDLQCASKLLEVSGINWRIQNKVQEHIGENILHIAAKEGIMIIINKAKEESNSSRLLLLSGENSQGETPLHLAAEYGQVDAVNAITSLSGTLTGKPKRSLSTIQVIIENEVEDQLAGHTRPWRMRSRNGDTPLHKALRNGHANIALHILKLDPELPSFVNEANESILYLAAEYYCDDVLEEILSGGYSMSFDGPDGQTPLHAAARNGGLSSVIQLLQRQPDLVSGKDHRGKTPLHYAAENGRYLTIRKLLEQDQSVGLAVDNEGFTALHRAASNGFELSVRSILELCSDSALLRDVNNRTVLHLAKLSKSGLQESLKHVDIAKLANETDKDGNSALHCAILDEDEDKALALLNTPGLFYDEENNQHKTPLHLCIEQMKNGDQSLVYSTLRDLHQPHQPRQQIRKKTWKQRIFRVDLTCKEEGLKQLLDKIAVCAAVIIAGTFQAALNPPGGYDPNTGYLVLQTQTLFLVFRLSIYLAFLSSITVLIQYTFGLGQRVINKKFVRTVIRFLKFSLFCTVMAFWCSLSLGSKTMWFEYLNAIYLCGVLIAQW